MDERISENILAHDKVYKKYESNHGEIYNEVEQNRLRGSLQCAASEVKTGSLQIKALDFGCGAGNLTQYLLQMNMAVTAADISVNFLKLVKHKYSAENVHLDFLHLNGTDLSNVENNSFDFIALYSVLHHVPDYLGIVKEFSRILKPGGVLYIDHEASPSVWRNDDNYKKYSGILSRVVSRKTRIQRIRHLFVPEYWKNAVKERLNPKYKPEGDIHVFQDDHIEWDMVEGVLNDNDLDIVRRDDYLLFTRYCPKNLYEKYKGKCDDIRLVIARKRSR